MVVAYVCGTTVLALDRWPHQPASGYVVLANLLYLLLIGFVARAQGPAVRIIRVAYPLVLLGALYPAIDILHDFGGVPVHDAAVRGWELAIFGREPSRTWWQTMPSRFWSTVLHGAYFAYYPIVFAPLFWFLARGEVRNAERAVAWLVAAFLACYVVFLLYPVAGPYYEYPRPSAAFLDNPMASLVYATLARGSAYGAAFPSSHVAATIVATAAAFRGSARFGWLLAVPSALLSIGVVYCQMHYAVDAVAGMFVAAGVVAVGLAAERTQSDRRP
jgi:PAP2 superfamily protein